MAPSTIVTLAEVELGVIDLNSHIKNGIHLNGNGFNGVKKYRKEVTYGLYENDIDKIEEEVIEDDNIEAITKIDSKHEKFDSEKQFETQPNFNRSKPYKLVWINILAMLFLHIAFLVGGIMIPFAKIETLIWMFVLLLFSSLGVQAGAHRLWSHRTYKANFGLRLFLSLCHVLALQNDIYEWCRDHRAHHKFSDTDADPHNSTKGFFFSHVGWLLVKKHPDVIRRGKSLNLSDLEQDPIVMFQRKYYIPMVALFWGLIPTFVPVLLWGESFIIAGAICVFTRYVVSLNITWCVNSWAHIYGYKPYDERLAAVEASIRHMLMGEGFHNYHHAFPWDYSASELGALDVFNPATASINFFHWMGWAWDLKKVNPELINRKKLNNGDPVYFHKRNTAAYEWVTGLLSIACPVVLVMLAHKLFHKETDFFDLKPWFDWSLNMAEYYYKLLF